METDKTPQIRQNTDKLLKFVAEKFEEGELDNVALVEFIKLSGTYLNLKTPSAYAKANCLSYQGVIKCRHIERLFGCKFVIDNE